MILRQWPVRNRSLGKLVKGKEPLLTLYLFSKGTIAVKPSMGQYLSDLEHCEGLHPDLRGNETVVDENPVEVEVHVLQVQRYIFVLF